MHAGEGGSEAFEIAGVLRQFVLPVPAPQRRKGRVELLALCVVEIEVAGQPASQSRRL
jgi:hypothetical protein